MSFCWRHGCSAARLRWLQQQEHAPRAPALQLSCLSLSPDEYAATEVFKCRKHIDGLVMRLAAVLVFAEGGRSASVSRRTTCRATDNALVMQCPLRNL
jgi:hypothetical protein